MSNGRRREHAPGRRGDQGQDAPGRRPSRKPGARGLGALVRESGEKKTGRGAVPASATSPLVLLALLLTWTCQPPALAQQTDILLQVQGALGGLTSSWGQGSPCGDPTTGADPWMGLSCSGDSVTSLNLVAAQLQGTIPTALFSLHNLTFLSLAGNEGLTGTIPDGFAFLPKLETVDLGSCSLGGPVPPSLGSLPQLRSLSLNNNQLAGSLPSSIGSSGLLTWIDINTNAITGPLPEALSLSTGLQHLHLSYNRLTSFPSSLTALQNLVHILADNNQFSQPFPTDFGTLKTLQILRLSNNNWTAADVGALLPPFLAEFYADRAFSGSVELPDFATRSPLLQVIRFSSSGLLGTLPSSLASLKQLYTLSLANNSFSGQVPLFSSQEQPLLQTIDLQNNHISNVPFANLGQPYNLSLAGNNVCKNSDIDVCVPTTEVPSWGNSTTICPGFSCPGSPTADAGTLGPLLAPNPVIFSTSNQECSCSSPLGALMTLSAPSFSAFNTEMASLLQERVFGFLTLAKVQGLQRQDQIVVASARQRTVVAIPFYVTVFFWPLNNSASLDSQAIKNALTNNKVFLEQPFGLQYTSDYQDPVPVSSSTLPTGISTGALAGIIVAGAVLLLLLVTLIAWLLWRARKKLQDDWTKEDEALLEDIDSGEVKRYSFRDLQEATNDFATLLGSGGFGGVYRGTLPAGDQVAVKRALPSMRQDAGTFRNEIELLSRIRHRNLVGLVGYCRERGEQLLVYECEPNGTLHDHLFEGKGAPLTWLLRLRIAECAARGLLYLHENIDPPIIHRDIKPSNILLSQNWEAKLADFGLSRVVPVEEGGQAPADSVYTMVKGTIGYLDPQYFESGKLTKKSDVYSFGIVLLELATGWKRLEENKHVRTRVLLSVARDGIMSVVDPRIQAPHTPYGGTATESAAPAPPSPLAFEALVRLAMHCSHHVTERRPSMGQVLEALVRIRAAEAGTGPDRWRDSSRLAGVQGGAAEASRGDPGRGDGGLPNAGTNSDSIWGQASTAARTNHEDEALLSGEGLSSAGPSQIFGDLIQSAVIAK